MKPQFYLPHSFEKKSRFKFRNSNVGKIIEHENKPFIELSSETILCRQLRSNLNLLIGHPQNSEKFPGNLPVSLMKTNIDTLYHGPTTYAVLEKTDGIRYLCFFTTLKQQGITVLIDRAFHFFLLTDTFAHEDLYQGTILDVEYIQIDSIHTFFVFDILAAIGTCFLDQQKHKQTHYLDRMFTAQTLIKELLFPLNDLLGIEFKIKHPFPICKLKQFIENELPKRQKKKNIPIDGFIFVPLEHPYHKGQDYSTFKWKNGNDHTGDFILRLPQSNQMITEFKKNNNLHSTISYSSHKLPVELWVSNSSSSREKKKQASLILYTRTYIHIDSFKKLGVTTLLQLDQKVVQCRLHPEEQLWIPEKIRSDRKFPNQLETIQKTEQNIIENILLTDLYCHCEVCQSPEWTKNLLWSGEEEN